MITTREIIKIDTVDREMEARAYHEYSVRSLYKFRSQDEVEKCIYQIKYFQGNAYRSIWRSDGAIFRINEFILKIPALEIVSFEFYKNGKCAIKDKFKEIKYAQTPFGAAVVEYKLALQGA